MTWSNIALTDFSWLEAGLKTLKFSKSVNMESKTWLRTVAGLQNATLELAVMVYQPNDGQTAGIQFELLRTYPLCVAMTATHPFARLKSITLEKLATEPLVGLRRKDYSEYYRIVDRVFASVHAKPRIAVECDSASSLITEPAAGGAGGLSKSTEYQPTRAGKKIGRAV